MVDGWILLHRKLQECEIWNNAQPFDMRSAWVDLLLLANHRDVEIVFDYKPMIIKRGQYLTSVRKLSARWSWSKNRTLKYLRLLESLNMITRESDKQRTLVTVVKYEFFQDCRDTGVYTNVDTGMDTVVDTGMPQTKNEKNEKNNKHIYGEYQHVRLTDDQYKILIFDYSEQETLDAIKFLDEYIEMKGYKAKNHNLALRKWVVDAVRKEKAKTQSTPKPQNKFEKGMLSRTYDFSELEKEAFGGL